MVETTLQKLIPADARWVSRVLKQAGYTRANRIEGTSGSYTRGYNVSRNQVAMYGYHYDDRSFEAQKAALAPMVATLEHKGFWVRQRGTSLDVYKYVVAGSDDEATFFSNLYHCLVLYADGTVLGAHDSFEIKQEQQRRYEAARARQKAAKEAENERKNRQARLMAWLAAEGVETVGMSDTTKVQVNVVQLDELLNRLVLKANLATSGLQA